MKDFTISLNISGEQVVVTDSTEWGTIENGNRSSYAVIAGVLKFHTEIGWIPLKTIDEVSQLSYLSSFDNLERSSFTFKLDGDGYHVVRFLYAIADDSSATEEGSIYYDSAQNKLYIKRSSQWIEVSISDAIKDETVLSKASKRVGFNPVLEKGLGVIWNRYELNGLPAKGEDYKNFYTVYGMLVGAISSLRQLNYAEYDRKIQFANKLVSRWK